MQLEISEAGKRAAEQLEPLQAKEFGGCNEPHNDVGVTILKILTIIGGIFFAMLSATSLPPEMAFICITLIAITVATLVTGAEKIVAIFPRGIWVWGSGERHPPVVIRDSRPPPSRWTWYNPGTWGGRTSSGGSGHSVYTGRGGDSGGHSVHPSSGGSGSSPSSGGGNSAVGSGHSSSRGNAATTGGYSAVGGGHSASPIVGGTPGNVASGGGHHTSPIVGGTPGNVSVGSGLHDRSPTTPTGNVVPGSGRSRK